MLELEHNVGGDPQRVDNDVVVVDLDEVKAPERGGVLVLAAAFDPELLALDRVRQLGELIVRRRDSAELSQAPQPAQPSSPMRRLDRSRVERSSAATGRTPSGCPR